MSALTDTAPDTPSNATPSSASQSAPALPTQTPYLHTPTVNLISADLDLNALIDKSHPPSLKPHDPPTARELHALHDKIRDNVLKSLEKRGETCERNLRAVVQKRKESAQQERDREAAEQQQAADRIKKERDDGAKAKKIGQKRSHAESEDTEEKKQSVPSVGEHMLARQDGVGVHEGMSTFLVAFSRKVLSFTCLWRVRLMKSRQHQSSLTHVTSLQIYIHPPFNLTRTISTYQHERVSGIY